jgi:hypothetical protein
MSCCKIDKILLVAILLICSCTNPKKEKNNEINVNNPDSTLEKSKGSRNDKPIVDGIHTSHYENGNVKSELRYLKGKLEGKQLTFYENGNVRSESYYKHGLIDSVQKWYFSNGSNKSEYFRYHGNRFGVQKEYDSSGRIKDMFFINSCDTCMTLDLVLNRRGEVIMKRGNLVSCVINKALLTTKDTAIVIFYTVVPPSYDYECKIIEKKNNNIISNQSCKLEDIDKNKGFFFTKPLMNAGDYEVGLSIALRNGKSYLKDTTYFKYKVIKSSDK